MSNNGTTTTTTGGGGGNNTDDDYDYNPYHIPLYLVTAVVMVILLVAVAIFLLLCLRRWKKRRGQRFETMEAAGDSVMSSTEIGMTHLSSDDHFIGAGDDDERD